MNTFKSSSRDNSPNSKLNIKKIPFTNDSFKKNPNQITTKIPSKVVKYDKINNTQKNILGNNANSLTKALNNSNLSNNKSTDRNKSNSRDFSTSFKSTQPSNNNKSFKKDSNAVSKSISKENIRDKSGEKNELKNSYDRNITLKKENIKSFNYNNTNSLLKKYENFQNKKSLQINKSIDKKDSSYTNHTRNHSKDSFKNISPKSNEIKNKPLSKPRTPDRSEISSVDKRKNHFVSPSSLQSKIDFRQMNTSPLLANKKFKKNSISVSTNSQPQNKVIMKPKIAEPQKLEIKEVKDFVQVNKIKDNGVKKFINKIYEISRIGYQGPGVKKQNQDNYFIYENFLNDSDSIFLGVCDGHGINGHDVSKFLRETIPKEVNNKLLNLNNQNLKNDVIKNTFIDVNNSLISKYKSDVKFSGSTCVSLIYTLNSLLCANVGDSRCILGKSIDNKGNSNLIIN
jgi:hypothetical protein